MLELVALHYSPWSEKARWALDHHKIDYRYAEYVPMLGELPLRIRSGKMRGRISVPVLFEPHKVTFDSFAIAHRADRLGKQAPLFSADEAAIAYWNEKSETALEAGRMIVIENVAADTEAKIESLPPFVPSALRAASTPVAALGTRFLAKKYASGDVTRAAREGTIDEALTSLRAALAGKDYLLGAFSYADIAMAVALQMVRPVDDAFMPLGPATRRCWTNDALAEGFADLIEWRDRLYARHRPKRADAA